MSHTRTSHHRIAPVTPASRRFASFAGISLGAVVAAALSFMPAATAQAQGANTGLKIGFVSTERIMRDSSPAKAAQAKIEQDFSRREKELQDLGNKLRSASERLEKDSAVLADNDRQRRQREIAEMDRDFQRRQREFREDLNQRRNEELSAVLERANRAIKEIAEREKFDLILQEAVFVSPRLDITELVVKQLNAGPR